MTLQALKIIFSEVIEIIKINAILSLKFQRDEEILISDSLASVQSTLFVQLRSGRRSINKSGSHERNR
jgi:hypothetical protein